MGATIQLQAGDHDDYDIAVTRSGVAVSLAGAQLLFRARRPRETAVLLQKSIGDGIAVQSAADGTAVIQFAPGDTARFQRSEDLRYELELTEASGRVTTIAYGVLQVRADFT